MYNIQLDKAVELMLSWLSTDYGAVYMISGTRDTLPPELPLARQNHIHIIAAETQVFTWKVLNSPRLVGSPWGRATLFTKEGDPSGGDNFYPCKQFVSANRDNFSDKRMRNKTFNRETIWRLLFKTGYCSL